MTTEGLAQALAPTIQAALVAEFGAELEQDEAFAAKVERISRALAAGVANGLVPYLQGAETVVVDLDGTPSGRIT